MTAAIYDTHESLICAGCVDAYVKPFDGWPDPAPVTAGPLSGETCADCGVVLPIASGVTA